MSPAIDSKYQQRSKLKRFKKLVFIGSSRAESSSDMTERLYFNANSSFLTQAPIGSSIEIEGIYVDRELTHQLNNLGLRSGKIAKLIDKTSSGSVVIDLQDISIAIGKKIARQIVVTMTKETL